MSLVQAKMILGNTGCLFLPGICIPFYRITEKEWILLDCGPSSQRENLLGFFRDNGIEVRAVLVSHAHYDHVENCSCLQERYGARIVMTAFDAGMTHNALALKACFYSHTVQDNEVYCGQMVCRADQILSPGAKEAEVCGVIFKLFPLPGHAASHMGIETPDGVIYLADSLFGPRELEWEKLFYMLDWTRALETMEWIRKLPYKDKAYVLAHQGIVREEIASLAEKNLRQMKEGLEEMRNLCQGENTLEELAGKVARAKNTSVKTVEKARLLERLVRSMAEYWLEQGELNVRLRDGILVYVRREEKNDV